MPHGQCLAEILLREATAHSGHILAGMEVQMDLAQG